MELPNDISPEQYEALVRVFGETYAKRFIQRRTTKQGDSVIGVMTKRFSRIQQRIEQLQQQQKDAVEAAQAQRLIDLVSRAEQMEIDTAGLIELIRQTSIGEVEQTLTALQTRALATGGKAYSPLFGNMRVPASTEDIRTALYNQRAKGGK